jgi:hypothetical protein
LKQLAPAAQQEMTDEQFRVVLIHLRIIIAILAFAVGIMIAFAWQYL